MRQPGKRGRLRRLLLEADHPAVGVDGDDAEPGRVVHRDLDGRHRHVGAVVGVGVQHLAVVHLVDVVAGQHHDVARRLALDRVEVLVDGVGRAEVPVLADALLGRQDLDELVEFLRDDVPAHADVPVQRQRLVLRGDEHSAQARVDAVREDEVDDPVGAAEVDRRLGAVPGQRGEALAGASGEHDDECVVANHGLLPGGDRRWHRACRGAERAGRPESTTSIATPWQLQPVDGHGVSGVDRGPIQPI